jgi:hypothetical protein
VTHIWESRWFKSIYTMQAKPDQHTTHISCSVCVWHSTIGISHGPCIVTVEDAERRPQGNPHEAPPHAQDLRLDHDRQHHDRLHLHHSFCRKGGGTAQRWSLGLIGSLAVANRSGCHQGNRRPLEITTRRRSPRMKPPGSGHVSAYDWQGIEIIINTKRP